MSKMKKKLKKFIKQAIGEKKYYLIKGRSRRVNWLLNKPKLPKLNDNKRFIHLGCGRINHPDFINVDLCLYPHVHYLRDIKDLTIFPDSFADLIYVSHCLEHIPHPKVASVLMEWWRVLKPGGILRLSVPDFDTMVQIYEENEKDLDLIIGPLMGAQDFSQDFHYICFNEKTLSRHLLNAGFFEVRKWIHGSGPYTSLPDWSGRCFEINGKTYNISLNLEGIK
jgi:SAM-dependent methyltransferase